MSSISADTEACGGGRAPVGRQGIQRAGLSQQCFGGDRGPPRSGSEGGADGGQGEGGDGGGDDAHHGSDEPAVRIQRQRAETVVPRRARVRVGLQDGEGFLERVGGLHPPVGDVDRDVGEGGGVQDGLDDGLGVHPPDSVVGAVGDAGVRGEGLGSGGGAHRVLASGDGVPRHQVRERVAEHALRVEHSYWTLLRAGGEGGLEVVGLGGGGDDRSGGVEDRVDRDVQALAGAGGSDDQDAALDRRPDGFAVRGAEKVARVGGSGFRQGGSQGAGLGEDRFRGGDAADRVAGRPSGSGVEGDRAAGRCGGSMGAPAQHPPGQEGHDECGDGDRAGVYPHGDAGNVGRALEQADSAGEAERRRPATGGEREQEAGCVHGGEQHRDGDSGDDDGLLDRERPGAGGLAGTGHSDTPALLCWVVVVMAWVVSHQASSLGWRSTATR